MAASRSEAPRAASLALLDLEQERLPVREARAFLLGEGAQIAARIAAQHRPDSLALARRTTRPLGTQDDPDWQGAVVRGPSPPLLSGGG